MNLVGRAGRGESVWLGFFLYDVLIRFAGLARLQGDSEMVTRFQSEAERLRVALEQHGWDGEWYRRAYFDDGTLLGSSSNTECRIDAIPQSWSVLSGAAPVERSRQAMDSLHRDLVDGRNRVVRLLAPAFDSSPLEPGYIKGYVPGVRENGGQYTHSAAWAAMAFAALNDSDRAWEVMDLINPIKHSASAAASAIYKVEPYVVAGDIYARAPHTGRGGWSWYTGAAGWTYRLILESLLGVVREGSKLHLRPCVPDSWSNFEVSYRFGQSLYRIAFTRTEVEGDVLVVDGREQDDLTIELRDDQREHRVQFGLGTGRPRLPHEPETAAA
jgi:cellobiose phosphorylase